MIAAIKARLKLLIPAAVCFVIGIGLFATFLVSAINQSFIGSSPEYGLQTEVEAGSRWTVGVRDLGFAPTPVGPNPITDILLDGASVPFQPDLGYEHTSPQGRVQSIVSVDVPSDGLLSVELADPQAADFVLFQSPSFAFMFGGICAMFLFMVIGTGLLITAVVQILTAKKAPATTSNS